MWTIPHTHLVCYCARTICTPDVHVHRLPHAGQGPNKHCQGIYCFLLLLLLFVRSVLLLKCAMASTPSDFGQHHQFLRCVQALQVRTNIENSPPELLCNPETRGELHSHVMPLTGLPLSPAACRKCISASHASLHNTGSRHWLSPQMGRTFCYLLRLDQLSKHHVGANHAPLPPPQLYKCIGAQDV